jgi:hypothetical protein
MNFGPLTLEPSEKFRLDSKDGVWIRLGSIWIFGGLSRECIG